MFSKQPVLWFCCFCYWCCVPIQATAATAASQLSCDFDQHHACGYVIQGWLMEAVENTGILCVIPRRNGYLLFTFTQKAAVERLDICLKFNYRQTDDKQVCFNGKPRLTMALDAAVHWSLETTNNDFKIDSDIGWTRSQVSLSVRRNQSQLRINACGVCLDNLTAVADRCPVNPADLNWGLRLVAVDPLLWLAPFAGLAFICLASGIALSLSLSRRRQNRQRRQAGLCCYCCCSADGEEAASNADCGSNKCRRQQQPLQTPRTPPSIHHHRQDLQQQRSHPHSSQLLLLLGDTEADNQTAENSKVALRLSAHQQFVETTSAGLSAAALPETSASACGSRGHRPLSIPATCTFVMSAERFGAPTPTTTPTPQTPSSAPTAAPQRQHSTSLSLSCPGRDLEYFRDPDASSDSDGDGAGGGGDAASRLLVASDASTGAPTVPRRFSPTLSGANVD